MNSFSERVHALLRRHGASSENVTAVRMAEERVRTEMAREDFTDREAALREVARALGFEPAKLTYIQRQQVVAELARSDPGAFGRRMSYGSELR